MLELNIFDTNGGLPVHALGVHFAVVLLPLSSLALLAEAVRPAWRRRYGFVTFACLTVGVLAALVSKLSGEQLATHVGRPAAHATWATVTLIVSALLWLVSGADPQDRHGRCPALLGPDRPMGDGSALRGNAGGRRRGGAHRRPGGVGRARHEHGPCGPSGTDIQFRSSESHGHPGHGVAQRERHRHRVGLAGQLQQRDQYLGKQLHPGPGGHAQFGLVLLGSHRGQRL